jgi:hypothetical protein
MLKEMWSNFVKLKAWQRLGILLVIFLVALSALSDSSTSENEASPSPSASPSSSATPTPTPTESATPTASATPTPESPLEFRFSALRDLKDLRKDVRDAQQGISEEGLGKFYWNVVEIQFNMTQLETLLPREEYEDRWNAKLAILKAAVEKLDTSDENLTISKAKSQLNAVLNAIPALESIAKSLAN